MQDWILRAVGFARRRRAQARRAPRPARYAVLVPPGVDRAVFVKTYAQDAEGEFVRGKAIYEGGVRSGDYRAPQPLEIVPSQGVVFWEHISPLQESRDYLLTLLARGNSAKQARLAFFSSLGKVLASVHKALSSIEMKGDMQPLREIRSPYAELNAQVLQDLAAGPMAPLHWDFVLGNIFVHETKGAAPQVVVLDAMPNHYLRVETGTHHRAPVQVDLGLMFFSLSCHPNFAGWFAAEETELWNALLAGYEQASGMKVNASTVLAVAGELTLRFQEYRNSAARGGSFAEWLDRRFRLACAARLFKFAMTSLPERALKVTA